MQIQFCNRLFALPLVLTSPAFGNDNNTSYRKVDELAAVAVLAESGKSAGPSASLLTSSSSSRASIAYTYGKNEFVARGLNDHKTQYSFTLSAPLQSGNKPTDFANQDGLVNAFTGTFKLNRFIKHYTSNSSAVTICGMVETKEKVRKQLEEDRNNLYARETVRQAVAAALEVDVEDLEPVINPQSDCRAIVADLEEAGDTFVRTMVPRSHQLLYPFKYPRTLHMSFYGIEATLGYEEFKFLNPDKFTSHEAFDNESLKGEVSTKETPWSMSANYGQVLRDGWIWKGSFRYERKYEAAPKVTRCPAVDSSEVFECLTGAASTPDGQDAYIASLEIKKFFSLGGDKSHAVSLIANYNLADDIVSLDIPIYLISNKDGQLTGGIRVGWRSDTNDPVFGIFVGVPFSVF